MPSFLCFCVFFLTFFRRFAKGERETAQQVVDSSALSFDDELKAKLEAHNKVLKKGKHTYEPAASVKDCRMVSQNRLER